MVLAALFVLSVFAWLYWRYIWFFRNPARKIPAGDGLLSPADGAVVYVKNLDPGEEIISIKKNIRICVNDIVGEDLDSPRVLIGIFMSPFNVHYNRAPLSGRVQSIRYIPPRKENRCMAAMHLRVILGRRPLYRNSLHIAQNERMVTRIGGIFKGREVPCHVIQIAGRTVKGIESFAREGTYVEKGAIFGMIRIGSQVDVVVPSVEGMTVRVQPGDRVRAGESVLIE
jgi:phosphatidylserine decarboxylase